LGDVFCCASFSLAVLLQNIIRRSPKKNPASIAHVEERYTIHCSWKVSSHRFIAE